MDFSFHVNGDQTPNASHKASLSSPTVANRASLLLLNGPDGFTRLLVGIAGLSVVLTAALFGWQYYLTKQIETKKQQLVAYGTHVSELPLQEIRTISTKLKLANTIAKQYPFVTNTFSILEDSIENQVTYIGFDLKTNQEGEYEMNISAIAPDYKTVARQMDILRTDTYKRYLKHLDLLELAPDAKGGVGFRIKTPIDLKGITPTDLVLSTTLPAAVDFSNVITSSSTVIVGTSTEPQTP